MDVFATHLTVRDRSQAQVCSVDMCWQESKLLKAVVRGELSGHRVIRLGARRVEIVLTPGKAVRLRGSGLERA